MVSIAGKLPLVLNLVRSMPKDGVFPFLYMLGVKAPLSMRTKTNHFMRAIEDGSGSHLPPSIQALLRRLRVYWNDPSAINGLEPTLKRLLQRADRYWDAGKADKAAVLIADILDCLFYKDYALADSSPFVVSSAPTEFLRASRAYNAVTAARSRMKPHYPSRPGTLLLAHQGTNHFFADQRAYLERQGWKVLDFDVAGRSDVLTELKSRELARRAAVVARGGSVGLTPQLQAVVDQADVVWIEWGTALAAYITQARLDKPVMIRVHRYEAQTQWPQFVEASGCDGLVFVSEWVRRVLLMHRPGLSGVMQTVIPLGLDARRFDLDKDSEAAHTLGLIGWSLWLKDPDFALDVLDALRERDERWRLLLVGSPPVGPDAWVQALMDRVAEYGDAVETLGQRGDVPQVLRRVGYILSTSRLESFHQAVVEGIASGAVPVVRDWPEVKGLGGAASIYPSEWLVDTPVEAAERVLATPLPFEQGREYLESTLSLERINAQVVRLLLGKGSGDDGDSESKEDPCLA